MYSRPVSTPRDFSCARGIRLEELDDDELAARRTMMEYDGAEHARLRRLVGAGFSRKSIATYEGSVRELAAQVLDRALELGELDFVEEVSRELPIRMLCRILGVPEGDAGELVEWGDALISNADPEFSMAVVDQEDTEAFRLLPFRSPAARSVFEYASRIREERLRRPTEDVISAMLVEDAGGRPLTELEFQNFFLLLIVARQRDHPPHHLARPAGPARPPGRLRGSGQSSRRPPTLRVGDRGDPSAGPSVTMHFRRTLTRDLDLDGVRMRRGDKTALWYIAANRDPDAFPEPDRFDIRRDPNPHLAFGAGRHVCLGAWLARLEVRVTFEELFRRIRVGGAHRSARPAPLQLHSRGEAPAGAPRPPLIPEVPMPHRPPSPLAQLAVPLALAALLLAPAPAPAQGPFTLEQVMSAPFPTALTASPDGSRVAWVFDEQGARNVWAAAAPDFGGLRFTSFEGDDGTTIHSLAFSRDALHIAFIRGDGPNRAGELPNPTSDPAGVEQALWVIEGAEHRRITEPAASPLFTADGDSILFLRRGRVWKVGLEADAEPEQLIHGRGSFGDLRLSPDGGRLAFVSSRGAHSFVGVYDFGAKTVHYLDPGQWTATARRPSRPTGLRSRSSASRRCWRPTSSSPSARARPGASRWWTSTVTECRATSAEVFRASEGKGSVFSGTASANQLHWTGDGRILFPWEREGYRHFYAVLRGRRRPGSRAGSRAGSTDLRRLRDRVRGR